MAPHFPQLIWQTSDRRANHPGIRAWLNDSPLENWPPPLAYEVGSDPFPTTPEKRGFDVVFSANTLHIMPWHFVQQLIDDMGQHLSAGARAVFYGPFNYGRRYTADSNAAFDHWLKARNPQSAIRDFEAVENLMQQDGFALAEDIPMPANNRMLHFEKK